MPYKYRWLSFRNYNNGSLLYAVNFKGKRGVLTVDGKELLPVRYDDICMCDVGCRMCCNLYFVRIADDRFVIDDSGQRPLKRHYNVLWSCNTKGYCVFEEQIDGESYHIQASYDRWYWLGYMLHPVRNVRFGVIDKDENILIPATYDLLYWLDDDRLLCMRNGRRGVIDCYGNEIVPCIYQSLAQGPDRTYIANQSSKVSGVVDETGRIVLPFRDWDIRNTYYGAFRIYDREIELCGLYSSSVEELLPLEFDRIDICGDTLDYIAVRKNGEWYYVNSRNELVLL